MTPPHRAVWRAYVAVTVTALTVAMAACSSSGPSTSSNNSKSAATLVSQVTHDAEAAGWVHEDVNASESGHSLKMSNDVGTSRGRQLITIDGAHATVLLVGGVAYIQGDAAALTNYFGFPSSDSTKEAGKWISVKSSDSGFSNVTGAVTLRSDFGQVPLSGKLTKAPITEIDGQSVIPIRGSLAGQSGSASIPGTLYVTAKGEVLPVELQASGKPGSETVTWNNWGKNVQLTVPTGAVPISSLGG